MVTRKKTDSGSCKIKTRYRLVTVEGVYHRAMKRQRGASRVEIFFLCLAPALGERVGRGLRAVYG